ncbi:unnamed protein product, partial [Candidula unifasciata]
FSQLFTLITYILNISYIKPVTATCLTPRITKRVAVHKETDTLCVCVCVCMCVRACVF